MLRNETLDNAEIGASQSSALLQSYWIQPELGHWKRRAEPARMAR